MSLHPFTITIGHREHPRLSFAAMAPDSATCLMQHVDLAEVGERVDVQPAERMRDEMQSLADELKARRQATQQLQRRAMAIEPVTLPARAQPASSSYGRLTCSLCGEASDSQCCAGCSGHFERGGSL